jgi:hypothetical protein
METRGNPYDSEQCIWHMSGICEAEKIFWGDARKRKTPGGEARGLCREASVCYALKATTFDAGALAISASICAAHRSKACRRSFQ